MYIKHKNQVIFFNDLNKPNTDKVFYARVIDAIKTNDGYEYHNYYAKFVGKARAKVVDQPNKSQITLIEWAILNPYIEAKKQTFPYIMVYDYEPDHMNDLQKQEQYRKVEKVPTYGQPAAASVADQEELDRLMEEIKKKRVL